MWEVWEERVSSIGLSPGAVNRAVLKALSPHDCILYDYYLPCLPCPPCPPCPPCLPFLNRAVLPTEFLLLEMLLLSSTSQNAS